MKKLISLVSAKSAATEVLSIVIGVLLALAVNEWNENRVHTSRANEAILNVIHEIESNIQLITIVNKNNQAIVDLLQKNNENIDANDNRNFVPGLQIQDTAWKTLLSTGVSEYINYSNLYQMSSIYSLQDIYTSLSYQLVQSMMSSQALIAAISPEEPKELKDDLFLDNMILIVEVEKALLSSYQKTIKHLKSLPLKD